ncbi:MAG: dynamin family protein, partial [Moorea sp. SIO4E2]|nr:dynamin family protein [Moorena sp. SIO4E2]
MSKVEQLRDFNNFAESILNKLEEYDSVLQTQSLQQDRILTEISNQVEIVRKQAEEVVKSSSSPVKIAVMGEFKATKTTVLGSLLGYAGMLPDSRVAATGNVTHLNIVQVKGSQPTEFKFSVKYFNQNEIDQCLDFIVEELVVQAEAQLPSTQIASLKNFTSKDPDVWQNIIKWYDEVKNYDKTPGLENAIQELVVFVESYLRYGNNLCGQSLPIDNSTHAYAGLQLPNDPRSILDIKKFEQFPPEDEEQF